MRTWLGQDLVILGLGLVLDDFSFLFLPCGHIGHIMTQARSGPETGGCRLWKLVPDLVLAQAAGGGLRSDMTTSKWFIQQQILSTHVWIRAIHITAGVSTFHTRNEIRFRCI